MTAARFYHPRMMLKVIIYGYMNNIYSCRKIENVLKRDVHFIWLAGYDQPDHKTLNNFRNRVRGRDRQRVHAAGVDPCRAWLDQP